MCTSEITDCRQLAGLIVARHAATLNLYRVPSEPTASTLGLELPAWVHANALQKMYSARSPVGLFEVLVMPRLLSSSATRAWSASNCNGPRSLRSFLIVQANAFLERNDCARFLIAVLRSRRSPSAFTRLRSSDADSYCRPSRRAISASVGAVHPEMPSRESPGLASRHKAKLRQVASNGIGKFEKPFHTTYDFVLFFQWRERNA